MLAAIAHRLYRKPFRSVRSQRELPKVPADVTTAAIWVNASRFAEPAIEALRAMPRPTGAEIHPLWLATVRALKARGVCVNVVDQIPQTAVAEKNGEVVSGFYDRRVPYALRIWVRRVKGEADMMLFTLLHEAAHHVDIDLVGMVLLVPKAEREALANGAAAVAWRRLVAPHDGIVGLIAAVDRPTDAMLTALRPRIALVAAHLIQIIGAQAPNGG